MSEEKQNIKPVGNPADEALEVYEKMLGIVRAIKEVPILPSEIPKDNNLLTRVIGPEQGGILTYMENQKYPFKGFPFYDFVDKIDIIKKICRQIQSGFYHALKNKNRLILFFLILFIPLLGAKIFWAFTYAFYRLIERVRVKVDKYCDAVREIHRAFSVKSEKESQRITELREMLRDIECMILEFDNAYRYRAQDILPEFDKSALRQNPIKEICRILDLLMEREIPEVASDEHRKNSWYLLKLFVKWYLRFDKELLWLFINVILELDYKKIELTQADKWFCIPRKDYKFRFIANPNSDDQLLMRQSKFNTEFIEEKQKLQQESTTAHELLGKIQQAEQQALVKISEAEQKAQLEKYQKELLDLEKKFQENQKNLIEKYMTPEQIKLADWQKQQRLLCDENYEKALKELEQKHQEADKKLTENYVSN